MGWVLFVVAAVLVLGIAFVAVGQVVGRMAADRPPAVYELPDAVDWIADRLPDEVTARLSYDEVRLILEWHLDWFDELGVASAHGQELAGEDIGDAGIIAAQEAAVDAVVARSLMENGPEPVDIVCVLDLQMRYLAAIGAVSEVDDDDS